MTQEERWMTRYKEVLAKMEKDGNIVDNDALAEQKKADWEKLVELSSKYDDEDDELEEDNYKEE